jgi:hypothetical protein
MFRTRLSRANSPLANLRRIFLVAACTISCWTAITWGQSADGDETAQPAPHNGSTEIVDIASTIRDLASSSFNERQKAHQKLLALGNPAIDALESAAKISHVEAAARCLDVLAQLARQDKSKTLALSALERLAKDQSNRFAGSAAKIVKELKTTDEERAIAALTAAGVRIHRRSSGEVFSIQITHDFQRVQLKHFPTLRSVELSGQEVTDATLDALAVVKQLSSLTLSQTSVSDAGLRKLKGLTGLNSLGLIGQTFTGDGLRQLQHVPRLRTLFLHSAVGERELELLTEVSQIESLYLSEVRFNQECVDILNQFKRLRRLALTVTSADDDRLQWLGQVTVPLQLTLMGSTNVTDAGWKKLEGARLFELTLMRTPITDAGMANLGAMPLLESLVIFDAPITDVGLQQLQRQKALQMLMLRNTKVTDHGVADLRRSLPNLRHVTVDAKAAKK